MAGPFPGVDPYPEMPDVLLDLQAVYNQAYDAGPYQRRIDYRSAPSMPLEEADAEWTDTLLRAKGFRR
jgi:hypothetical protein